MSDYSELYNKLNEKHEIKLRKNLCFWCDLLGFGGELLKNQWILDENLIHQKAERLTTAHKHFLMRTSPLNESNLVLNDGLVKVSTISIKEHLDIWGFYIRNCIETHIFIKSIEQENNLPGCRSILSFGDSIEYITPEVKLDDYVAKYTKKNPNELSEVAKRTGNPTIVYNPIPFQMNTAFSKSYILDDLGKKYNIEGSNFYIDSSVLDFMELIAKEKKINLINKEISDTRIIYLEKVKDSAAYFGFELVNKNEIEYEGWNTFTYCVKSFYPPDENFTEFKYDL